MRIAVDLMGSDASPLNLFEGILTALNELSTTIIVIASKEIVTMISNEFILKKYQNKLSFLEASEEIKMDENPAFAVRRKKNASLIVGLSLLGDKKVDAFVSAGNTGAIVLAASHLLKHLPTISRPALLALLPTDKKPLAVIDVGGNVTVTAQNMVDFARMGAAFQRDFFNLPKPKVALLNIGEEANRGTPEMRKAYDLLKTDAKESNAYSFYGNIEGKSAFHGKIDVLVTDGFSGNVFLKTSEGVASFIFKSLEKLMKKNRNLSDQSVNLKSFQDKFNSAEYPGAVLCGVDGIVIKCHGNATARSIYSGIKGASDLIEKKKNGLECIFGHKQGTQKHS